MSKDDGFAKEWIRAIAVGEIKTSKNGNEYRTIEYELIKVEDGKEVSTGILAERVIYPIRKVITYNEETDQESSKEWGNHTEFYNIKVGDEELGTIMEFKTTPYVINGKEFTSKRSVITSRGEIDPLAVVAKELKYYKAFPLDENGNIYEKKVIRKTVYRL